MNKNLKKLNWILASTFLIYFIFLIPTIFYWNHLELFNNNKPILVWQIAEHYGKALEEVFLFILIIALGILYWFGYKLQKQVQNNPYVYAVNDIPNWQHNYLFKDSWIHGVLVYGFLFSFLLKLICLIGNNNFWISFFLFKFLILIAIYF